MQLQFINLGKGNLDTRLSIKYIKFRKNGEERLIKTIKAFHNKENKKVEFKSIHHRGIFVVEDENFEKPIIIHSDMNGSFNMFRVSESNVNDKDDINDFRQIKYLFSRKLGNLPLEERKKIMRP